MAAPLTSDDIKRGILAAKAEAARRRLAKAQQQIITANRVTAALRPTTSQSVADNVVLVEPTPLTPAAPDPPTLDLASPTKAPPGPTSGCPFHPAATPGSVAPSAWPRAPPDAKHKKLIFSRAQPNVDELLATHASEIAALRVAIADTKFEDAATPIVPFDDLWLLRFLLSNGAAGAEKAVRATLKWREEKAPMLALAAAGQEHPLHAKIATMSLAEVYSLRTVSDEPVQLIRAGLSNVKRLMDTHTPEEVIEWMNFQKEQAFLVCDEATRRTRRLVKMVCVLDMHSSRFMDNDNRFFKALGRASKDSELYYPQLLAITVGVNVPGYLNLIWPIAKRLMPAKTLAKFRICSARDTVVQSAVQCPFATSVFTPETLVDFLGGVAPSTDVLGPPNRGRVP